MKKLELLRKNILGIVLAFVATGVVTLSGCNDDPVGPNQEIIEIINGTEGLDSLAKYLGLFPDVAAAVEADGDYTFFAPTNTAFIELLSLPNFPPNITSINPKIIANVLAYHVSATRYNSTDLTTGTEITTLAVPQDGVDEVITVNEDGTLLTGSSNPNIEIVTADIQATNGVIHTTNRVLIPLALDGLAELLPTIYAPLVLGADFSILAEGIAKADAYAVANAKTPLAAILTGTTFVTVFAPTNATFNTAGITAASLPGESWYGTIANHVVLSDVTAAALTDTEASTVGKEYFSALQNTLTFFNAGSSNGVNGIGIFIDSNGDVSFATGEGIEGEVALPDAAVRTNGRIHVIAGVLAPPAPQ